MGHAFSPGFWSTYPAAGNIAGIHNGALNTKQTSTSGATAQVPFQVAASVSKLQVSVGATGTARTVTARKNASNQSLSVSPTDSTAGQFYDNANSVAMSPADLLDFVVAGTGTSGQLGMSCMIAANSGHYVIYAYTSSNSFGFVAGNFYGIAGDTTGNSTESKVSQEMRTAGAAVHSFANIRTAASSGTSVFTLRKNAANVNNTMSIGSGLTGLFQDTSHTDNFVSGDLLSWGLTNGAGQAPAGMVGVGVTSTPASNEVIFGNSNFGASPSTTTFQPIGGGKSTGTPSSTESLQQLTHGFACKLSNMRCLVVTAATTGGTSSLFTRINGVNGNCTLSFASGLTGWFEDATNTDSVGANDLVCYGVQQTGTNGSATAQVLMVTETETANSGNNGNFLNFMAA